MKNVLLILFMLLLPWQSIAATERNLAHVTSSQQGQVEFTQHFTEHVQLVMHHHDDDGGESHDDDKQQSSRHLADNSQGFSMNALFPTSQTVVILPMVRVGHSLPPETFQTRSTLPPLRPPRTLV